MDFQRVDKKAKTKWRFSRIMGLIFGILPASVITMLICWGIDSDGGNGVATVVGWCIVAFMVVLQLLQILIYPPIEYIQWQYMIAPDRIEIKKGIFYRTHTVIPISRIQHVAVTQGVLQRPFKLSTVKIHTAGSEMEIQELNTEVAEEICARLQKRVNVKVEAKQAADAAQPSQPEQDA